MAEYRQTEIDALISCPKEVRAQPLRERKLVNASFRNDAKLVATDGTAGEFAVFMRQSEDFPEDFSIGLIYQPGDGRQDLVLLRCNGQHGEFTGLPGQDAQHPHWGYHIHRATEAALDAGFKAEKYAEPTTEFASYEEALPYFAVAINLNKADAKKHFVAHPAQLGLLLQ